jgi:lipopolysaccharide/colanic/teichoic acid biosynthesis glycosyltransferase
MGSTVSAQLFQSNVAEFPRPQRLISVRTGSSASAYARRHSLTRQARRDARYAAAKRCFDALAAGAGLLFLLPLFVAIAVAIRTTSRGPVFFRQYRYGYRGRLFKIYKFRTMHASLGDVSGVRQTTRGDARVTRIGRLLRKTSFDELPQLINVLKGDMSLVGPRPHVPGMLAADIPYEDLVPYYFQRHTARPGITGLAQVSGCRGSTKDVGAAVARINHDLDYIEKRSLGMDVAIIARTLKREFISGGGE